MGRYGNCDPCCNNEITAVNSPCTLTPCKHNQLDAPSGSVGRPAPGYTVNLTGGEWNQILFTEPLESNNLYCLYTLSVCAEWLTTDSTLRVVCIASQDGNTYATTSVDRNSPNAWVSTLFNFTALTGAGVNLLDRVLSQNSNGTLTYNNLSNPSHLGGDITMGFMVWSATDTTIHIDNACVKYAYACPRDICQVVEVTYPPFTAFPVNHAWYPPCNLTQPMVDTFNSLSAGTFTAPFVGQLFGTQDWRTDFAGIGPGSLVYDSPTHKVWIDVEAVFHREPPGGVQAPLFRWGVHTRSYVQPNPQEDPPVIKPTCGVKYLVANCWHWNLDFIDHPCDEPITLSFSTLTAVANDTTIYPPTITATWKRTY